MDEQKNSNTIEIKAFELHRTYKKLFTFKLSNCLSRLPYFTNNAKKSHYSQVSKRFINVSYFKSKNRLVNINNLFK